MLAHSPPLPLTVDYYGKDGITAEDEEGLMLALEQRNRVRHLRLLLPARNLQKFVTTIDGEFPILEYLIVAPPMKKAGTTALMLRETFQAQHLKHLMLIGFTYPIGPRLHPAAVGLVTLNLVIDHPSAFFQPNILLQWISFMPQLETLAILFEFPVPSRDVDMQLMHMPITTPITLPDLRWIWFKGVSAYFETIVCRIITPRLEMLEIDFFQQLTFPIPCLVQFMNSTENLRFNIAMLDVIDGRIDLGMFPYGAGNIFGVVVRGWHLDWQVSSMAQILNALSQVFSPVEHLILRHKVHSRSSEEHNEVDRIKWRKLLRPFNNVKFLRVEDGLVKEISQCLRLEGGELPLELLPELQELTYTGSGDTSDAFTSFIETRQNAGRPVTLIRPGPRPDISESHFVAPMITSASSEAGNVFET